MGRQPHMGRDRHASSRGGCRFASSRMAARVSTVAEPMCGTTMALGSVRSGLPGTGGSSSSTSSAAPASRDSARASAQRLLVDDSAAGGVHQVGGRLHQPQLLGADQVTGTGVEVDVQRNEVRSPKPPPQLQLPLDSLDRLQVVPAVPIGDAHLAREAPSGDLLADPSEPDQEQVLSAQVMTEGWFAPLAGACRPDRFGHVAASA